MLAAQCNKLSSKSPPPLADAAVGKGFHPWKKGPSGGNGGQQSPGPIIVSSGVSGVSPTQRSLSASTASSIGNVTPR